eukprot:COSAG05_NODE_332_length_11268_cov_132.023726_4_plen_125_part_00
MYENSYFIPQTVGTRHSAHVQCVAEPVDAASRNSGAVATLLTPAIPAAHGKLFQPYGYGGSHVLSAEIVRWWGLHPEVPPSSQSVAQKSVLCAPPNCNLHMHHSSQDLCLCCVDYYCAWTPYRV